MELPANGQSIGFLVLIGIAAALYSSVGQGGGSGYLAVMALYGMSPAYMKPAALIMNIFVTSMVWYRHYRAGDFNRALFWPFAVTSIPAAFIGGALTLGSSLYRVVVAAALLTAAWRMLGRVQGHGVVVRPAVRTMFLSGAALGLVSGATGVGGGIFLAPLVLYRGWCSLHETFALSAAFIWVNSVAAVCGYAFAGYAFPSGAAWLVASALAGTMVGARIVAVFGTPQRLSRLLGIVLAFAAIKMLVDI